MFPFSAYPAEKMASEQMEAWRREAEEDRYAAQLIANTQSRRPIIYRALALLAKPLPLGHEFSGTVLVAPPDSAFAEALCLWIVLSSPICGNGRRAR